MTTIDIQDKNFEGAPYVVICDSKTTDISVTYMGMPFITNDPILFVPIIMIY